MISTSEAVARFKEILSAKDSWRHIAESQFVHHLSVYVSWALRQALWFAERVFQESFRSTAINRASILTHAEDISYTPVRPQPSTGTVTITNNGAATLTVPIYQPLQSNDGVDYVTTAAVGPIAAGGSVTVAVAQMVRSEAAKEVEEGTAFFEVDAGDADEICQMAVFVNDPPEGFELWVPAKNFHNAGPTDQVYDEFYSRLGRVGIRFGNGTFGKIPPVGATVTIEVWTTSGATYLSVGQPMSVVGELMDDAGNPADVTITTATPVTGGTAIEGLESIRKNIQYWPVYNDQLVWDADYVYFLRRRFPDIVWVRVWGEAEAEAQAGAPSLDFVNTIFVSAYAVGGASIGADVIAALENETVTLINRRFQWVAPVMSEFTVSVTGKISRSRDLALVEAAIRDVLTNRYGANSAERMDKVLVKDIYAAISGTGYFDLPGEYFTVVTAPADPAATLLEEMVSVNLSMSTVSLGYL